MVLNDSDVYLVKKVFEEGKEIYTQDQFGMDIDMLYNFNADTTFFIYITPTLERLDGNGIKQITLPLISVLWDNILYNFCDLYNITFSQPQWYLTNETWS